MTVVTYYAFKLKKIGGDYDGCFGKFLFAAGEKKHQKHVILMTYSLQHAAKEDVPHREEGGRGRRVPPPLCGPQSKSRGSEPAKGKLHNA